MTGSRASKGISTILPGLSFLADTRFPSHNRRFPAIVKKNAGKSWLKADGTKINVAIHTNPAMNHIAAMI